MSEEEEGEAPERLGRWARSALVGFGLAVLVAAAWVGLYGLVFGSVYLFGGHGSTPRPIDRAVGLALLAFPPLMLALAGFSLFCSTRRRLAVVAALAAALIADAALAAAFLHLANRPEKRRPAGLTIHPDEESARRAHGFPADPDATHSGPCSLGAGQCAPPAAKAK